MVKSSILLKRKKFLKIFNKFQKSLVSYNSKYILIVIFSNDQFTRFTIHPVDNSPILKIELKSFFEKDIVRFLNKFLNNFRCKIIHTSGLVRDSNGYNQEFFISGDKKKLTLLFTTIYNDYPIDKYNIKCKWISS